MFLGLSSLPMGNLDDAIRAMETQAKLMGRSSLALGVLGLVYARTGRTGEARKLLEELQERAQKEYVPSWAIGLIFMGLGETEKCFDCFEKAADERDGNMLHFGISVGYELR